MGARVPEMTVSRREDVLFSAVSPQTTASPLSPRFIPRPLINPRRILRGCAIPAPDRRPRHMIWGVTTPWPEPILGNARMDLTSALPQRAHEASSSTPPTLLGSRAAQAMPTPPGTPTAGPNTSASSLGFLTAEKYV